MSFNDIVEKDFNEKVERELEIGSEATRARLVICVNTNICGKKNPTHRYGYGFAWTAIDCVRTLGPPWLEIRSGPCFIRCSRGVNARLIGNKAAAAAAGEEALRSRDLFQLNSVELCVNMLREELNWEVEPGLLASYRAYAEALVLLDETFARLEGASLPTRAAEALPLLDTAARYVAEHVAGSMIASDASGRAARGELSLAATLAFVVEEAVAARRQWAGSVWRESFYGSELRVEDAGGLSALAGESAAADGQATEGGVPTGGAAVLGSYGQRVYRIGCVGAIRGEVNGRELRGTWREALLDDKGEPRGAAKEGEEEGQGQGQ
jgi:hypothetical protein